MNHRRHFVGCTLVHSEVVVSSAVRAAVKRACCFILVIPWVCWTSTAQGSTLHKAFDQLPERKVTLDVVLGYALQGDDQFRQVLALKPQIEVAQMGALAPYDLQLSVGVSYGDNQNEQIYSFMPKARATTYSLGVATYFSTGTALSVEFKESETAWSSTPNFEAKTTVAISQALWRDAFGGDSRLKKEGGSLATRAAKESFDHAVAEWGLGLIEIFYKAWYAQASSRAALSNVKRRERLVEITALKLKRGTAERPDLLQVQSALLQTQAQWSDSVQNIGDLWRSLVLGLKLPSEWMKVDPTQVPMGIDEPIRGALVTCGSPDRISSSPQTAMIRAKELLLEKGKGDLKAAQGSMRPSLSLELASSLNGIDQGNYGTAWGEVSSSEHPSHSVGLKFSMPLSFYAERAQVHNQLGEVMKAEAQLTQARSQVETVWINTCLNLHRVVSKISKWEEALKNQRQRLRLEEVRFRNGQIPLLNVIQAGDEVTVAELNLFGSLMESRLLAWKVKRYSGDLNVYLEKLMDAYKLKTAESI